MTGDQVSLVRYSNNIGTKADPTWKFKTVPICSMDYWDHLGTDTAEKGVQFSDPTRTAALHMIYKYEDLAHAGEVHANDRVKLDEFYENEYVEHLFDGGNDTVSGFVRNDYLHCSFLRQRFIRQERNGDKNRG